MVTRYNVERLETGLFVHSDGYSCEEPEWFSCQEASALAGALDRAAHRNITRINAHDFSPHEEGVEQ